MRISTKRKGVCGTHERRRQRDRETETETESSERMMITGVILYEEKIQE